MGVSRSLPTDGASIGVIDISDPDLNFYDQGGKISVLSFVAKSASDLGFSCRFKGIIGQIRAIGVYAGTSAPTQPYTITISDEYGRTWVLPQVPAQGNPSIPLDDDIIIQGTKGYLTFAVDAFGIAYQKDIRVVIQIDHNPSSKQSENRIVGADGVSNDTTAVTMIAAPLDNKTYVIRHINIHNADTAVATVTVAVENSASATTTSIITKQLLDVDSNLPLSDEVVLDNASKSLTLVLGGVVTTNQLNWQVVYEVRDS